jgi:predicted N-acetyltransferase YhbS
LLVGDAPYYGRFGFTTEQTGTLALPGPFAGDRLLGRELVPGGLAGACGLICATGQGKTKSASAAHVAGLCANDPTLTRAA